MKHSISNVVWGIALVVIGILLAGDALKIFEFSLFFRGWWTLFIIIPCFVGLFERGDKTGYIIGLGIGVLLLLSSQNIFHWYSISRLIWPFILVVIGISILSKTFIKKNDNYYNRYDDKYDSTQYSDSEDKNSRYQSFDGDAQKENFNDFTDAKDRDQYRQNASYHGDTKTYTNILSGRTIRYDNEVFTGATITSILGGIDFDLRYAIIEQDVKIEATCILGGIDLYVPNNVRVVVNSTPILGGVDDKTIPPRDANCKTLFINSTCILGGMDVK